MKSFIIAFLLATLAIFASAKTAVRVAHASPDAPAVDVYVNGLKRISNLSFKDVSHYDVLEAGSYNFVVVPHAQTSPVVINATVPLKDSYPYTIAAINKLANIAPQVYTDDNQFPPVGKAAVRFVHLSPDAPAVDIALKNGDVLFSNVAYKQASNYLLVEQGTYNLEVRPTGTKTVVLALNNVQIGRRHPFTIFAEGLVGDKTLTAVVAEDI